MREDPKDNEKYEFINEKIVSNRRRRILKKLRQTGFVFCMAVLFGLTAEIVMLKSEDVLKNLLGLGEERQQVDLNRPSADETPGFLKGTIPPTPTETPVPTPTPTPTQIPKVTPELSVEPMPTETAIFTETPVPTPTSEISETPVPTEAASVSAAPTPLLTDSPQFKPIQPLEEYLELYHQISEVAQKASASLVTVEAIETGVDWFQETYTTRTRTTGLALANDGVDLLILVNMDRISGASRIEVAFDTGKVSGRVYSMSKSYGLAVIAVPLEELSEEVLDTVTIGILAAEEEIRVGTPVLALGAPNGYEGSMEVGMINSLGSTISVNDGQVAYFTTDITEQENGYGFVFNMEGEVLGIMTHTYKENAEDGIFSAISLDAIREIIIKLLNNEPQAYLGIKGQDLPESIREASGLDAGVYISEVENSSPALYAGIKAGDILTMFGEEPINGIRELMHKLAVCDGHETVSLHLKRRSEEEIKEIVLEVQLSAGN